jgi:hypothetical protein
MNYEKPEVVVLAGALKAIESGDKGIHLVADRDPRNSTPSNGAYEADE